MKSYHRIQSRDYITKLYSKVVLRHYITESYYGIILRDYITVSYYGTILYYGIILQNHPYEKDLGYPKQSPKPPGTTRDPAGTPLGHPRDAPGATGYNTDHKSENISANSERHKLSIAASQFFRGNA